MIDVALAHHLVSKYTSLVAVDVTPTAPPGTTSIKTALPTNLPEGASFEAIFGGAQTATPATLHLLLGLLLLLVAVIAWSSASRRTAASSCKDADMQSTADRGGPFGHRMPRRATGCARRRRASRSAIRGPSLPPSAVACRASTPRKRALEVDRRRLPRFGLALTGDALYIHAKALLAQALLHRAWIATQASGVPAKPWPWADTATVARLFAPAQDVDLLVLAGATGRTLAFGPGHHDGSAMPGEPGNTVLSAHRDTHFRFLHAIAVGDALIVEMPAGQRFHYRVREIEVADQRDLRLPRLPAEPTLTLVTC